MLLDLSIIDEGLEIHQKLKNHNAVYHKGCFAKLNVSYTMNDRLTKKREKEKTNENSANAKIPHKKRLNLV